jgi:hypothetical protein
VSTELQVPLATVCRVTGAARSTIYHRRSVVQAPRRRPGPKTDINDDQLTETIRQVIVDCPFAGEGHRKVRARLRRDHQIHTGKNRVLRLMRGAGLLAPQRAAKRRRPRPRWLNPIVRGWMTYYGRFYRSQMAPLLQRVNTYLRRWAARKYRKLRNYQSFRRWWDGVIQRQPRLFAQWQWVHGWR